MKPIKFKSPFWIIFFALIHVLVFFAGTVCLDNSRQYDSIEKVLTVALSALTQPLFSQFFYEDFNGYVKLLTFVLNSFIWGAVIWWTIKLACQKNRILTRKSLLSLLLLFFTFSTIVLFRRTVPSSIQDSPKEEMALLNTLLEARFSEEVTSGTSLIIKDTLSLKQIVRSSDINDVKKDLIQNALKRRLKEAIRDLFRKNTTNCDFSVIGNPSFNHVLISKKYLHNLFNQESHPRKDGWSLFYEKYPNSPGIISLSRVGFSRDGSVAVLYMGNQSGWLAGRGSLRVFKKKNGKWEAGFPIGPQWVS